MPEQDSAVPQEINDLDTAKLALRWALDRIRRTAAELDAAKEADGRQQAEINRLRSEIGVKEDAARRWRATAEEWEEAVKGYQRLARDAEGQAQEHLERREGAEFERLRREADGLRAEISQLRAAVDDLTKSLSDAERRGREAGRRETAFLVENEKRAHEQERLEMLTQWKAVEEDILARGRGLAEREAAFGECRLKGLEEQSRQFLELERAFDEALRKVAAEYAERLSRFRDPESAGK